MSKFIEVTNKHGNNIILNVDIIEFISSVDNCCTLYFKGQTNTFSSNCVEVKESYDEIKKMLGVGE